MGKSPNRLVGVIFGSAMLLLAIGLGSNRGARVVAAG
jgi:hypothetical protein